MEETSAKSHCELDRMIRDMSPEIITEMGQRLSAPEGKNYKHLAGCLGFNQDDVDRISMHDRPNPGRLLLREWGQRENTTARVLKHNLSQINRYDVIRILEQGLSEPVHLVVVIKAEDDGQILFDGVIKSFGQEKVIDALRSHEDVFKLLPELHSQNRQNIFDCQVKEFKGREMAFTRSKSEENERQPSQLDVQNETVMRTVNVQLMGNCENPPESRLRPEGSYSPSSPERRIHRRFNNSPLLNIRDPSNPSSVHNLSAASFQSETFVKGHLVYPAVSAQTHERDRSKTFPKMQVASSSGQGDVRHPASTHRRATIPNEGQNGHSAHSLPHSSNSEPRNLNSTTWNTSPKTPHDQGASSTPYSSDDSVLGIYLHTDLGGNMCGDYLTTTIEPVSSGRVQGLRGFHREATNNNIITHLFMPHIMTDGSYIIRPSRDDPTSTSISVVFRKCVVNYRVHSRKQKCHLTNDTRTLYHLFDTRCFKSIEDLIAYYKLHKIMDEDEIDGPTLDTPI